MFFIDDFSISFILQRAGAELLFDLLLYGSQKLILYYPVTVDIVRSDSGLSAV